MFDDGLEVFRSKVVSNYSEEEELQTECGNLISGPVKDAFASFVEFLENDYIPNLRTEISAKK